MTPVRKGLLWFDRSESSTFEKCAGAIEAYRNRYDGKYPGVVYAHSVTVSGLKKDLREMPGVKLSDPTPKQEVLGVPVVESNLVMPHHFWVGEK